MLCSLTDNGSNLIGCVANVFNNQNIKCQTLLSKIVRLAGIRRITQKDKKLQPMDWRKSPTRIRIFISTSANWLTKNQTLQNRKGKGKDELFHAYNKTTMPFFHSQMLCCTDNVMYRQWFILIHQTSPYFISLHIEHHYLFIKIIFLGSC